MIPEIMTSQFALGVLVGSVGTFIVLTLVIEFAVRKLDGPAVPNQRHANRR